MKSWVWTGVLLVLFTITPRTGHPQTRVDTLGVWEAILRRDQHTPIILFDHILARPSNIFDAPHERPWLDSLIARGLIVRTCDLYCSPSPIGDTVYVALGVPVFSRNSSAEAYRWSLTGVGEKSCRKLHEYLDNMFLTSRRGEWTAILVRGRSEADRDTTCVRAP
jgi:hypothetical protein